MGTQRYGVQVSRQPLHSPAKVTLQNRQGGNGKQSMQTNLFQTLRIRSNQQPGNQHRVTMTALRHTWNTTAPPGILGVAKIMLLLATSSLETTSLLGSSESTGLVLIITGASPPVIAIISGASAPAVAIIYRASPFIHCSITATIARITSTPTIIWNVVPSVPWAR